MLTKVSILFMFSWKLNIETEKNNVSILHHVFFTFGRNKVFF